MLENWIFMFKTILISVSFMEGQNIIIESHVECGLYNVVGIVSIQQIMCDSISIQMITSS